MISPKRNKSLKFNRVAKHNFKFAKRLSINKSINESNNNMIIYEHSPTNKKDKKRKSLSSAIKVAKDIEENYSLTKNRNPLKTMKKLHSTNKIQMIRFKDLILKQKNFLKKEEQKNETNNNLPIILKLEHKNLEEKKKFTSSNNIGHILKSYSKDLFKNFNRKSKIKNNNEIENENTNYDINNIVKIKKKKKESKETGDNKEIMEYKHNKRGKEHKEKKEHKNKKENHENKSKKEIKTEDNKINLNEENKENKDNKEDKKETSLNNVKCKFFCCL
jgi:hypothetical protein